MWYNFKFEYLEVSYFHIFVCVNYRELFCIYPYIMTISFAANNLLEQSTGAWQIDDIAVMAHDTADHL